MNDLERLFKHAPEGAVTLRSSKHCKYMRWFNADGEAYGASDWFTHPGGYETIATRPQPEDKPKAPETFGYDFEAEREKEKAMFEQAIEEIAKSIHNPQSEDKPQQPRKTVEDAVAGKWVTTFGMDTLSNKRCFVGYNYGKDVFFTCEEDYGFEDYGETFVCTREQFEAYVDAIKIGEILEARDKQEQITKPAKSEPKWAHVHMGGEKCKIIAIEPDVNGYVAVMWESGAYGYCKAQSLNPIKPTISKAEAWDMLNRIEGRAEFETVMNAVMSIIEKYTITN